MNPKRSILWLILANLFLVACLLLLLNPHVIRHDEALTIIDTRAGEIDINHLPGYRAAIWYQDIERGINVRLLVSPW